MVRERKAREKSACQHRGGNGVVVHGEKRAAFMRVGDKKWREVEAKRSRSQVREGLPCQILAQMVKNLPGVWKLPWRREWQPTQVFLPGEFCGQRSLAGYSPWGHKELHTTE